MNSRLEQRATGIGNYTRECCFLTMLLNVAPHEGACYLDDMADKSHLKLVRGE